MGDMELLVDLRESLATTLHAAVCNCPDNVAPEAVYAEVEVMLGVFPENVVKVDGRWVQLVEVCSECGASRENHGDLGDFHESGDPAFHPLLFAPRAEV